MKTAVVSLELVAGVQFNPALLKDPSPTGQGATEDERLALAVRSALNASRPDCAILYADWRVDKVVYVEP